MAGGGGGTGGSGTVTAYPQLRSWLFASTLVNFAASPVNTYQPKQWRVEPSLNCHFRRIE